MSLAAEAAVDEEHRVEPEIRRPVYWRDIYFTVHDGLRLYARDYGDRRSTLTPVVCLAGLTRNSKDYHALACELSRSRRVIVPDYRGRGLSDYTDDWHTYNPFVELSDTLALLAVTGVEEAVFVGTSRGGLIAMLLAALRPTVMKGVVLNDIGPEIAPEGLMRIRGYLEHAPKPANWIDAIEILKKTSRGFTTLSAAEWSALARRVFRDVRGKPQIDFDTRLRNTFISYSDIVYDRIPTLWPQFAAMSHLPCLVLRGENSDVLTDEIVERMQIIHPGLRHVVVANRGHTPFLEESESGVFAAIADFLKRCGD